MKIDIKGADVSKVSDKTFTRDSKTKNADAKTFFAEGAKKKVLNAERVATQKAVDGAIMTNMKADKKNPLIKKYLHARFSLSKNDKPHAMKF